MYDLVNIERSIIKKFRKEIWRMFVKAVRDYKMISEGDKIAVCISGGKDSFLLAKCLEELKRHGDINSNLQWRNVQTSSMIQDILNNEPRI